jgi:hypothetical protein
MMADIKNTHKQYCLHGCPKAKRTLQLPHRSRTQPKHPESKICQSDDRTKVFTDLQSQRYLLDIAIACAVNLQIKRIALVPEWQLHDTRPSCYPARNPKGYNHRDRWRLEEQTHACVLEESHSATESWQRHRATLVSSPSRTSIIELTSNLFRGPTSM